jgi:HK97 family phage prohead protease
VAPGATAASLPNLVRAGFLAWSHEYRSLPIGMIDQAHEDAKGLWIAGPFHSTPEAQAARTVAAERLAAGKAMGMSIGYDPKEWTYRTADEAQSGVYGSDQVRVLTRIDVLEGSLVPLPMNPLAQLAEVKADPVEGKPITGVHACRLREPSAFQAGSFRTMSRRHEGKPYNVIVGRLKGESTMTEQALRYAVDDGWGEAQARAHCDGHDGILFEPAAPKELALLAEAGTALASLKEGRELSASSRARIRAALEAVAGLAAIRDDLEAWLAATEPPPKSAPARLRFQTDRMMARLRREGLLT